MFKGACKIKEAYGDKVLTVFVKPPSFKELKERLTSRKTEDEKSLKKRINRVKEEMGYENRFDITLVNKDLDVALKRGRRTSCRFFRLNFK